MRTLKFVVLLTLLVSQAPALAQDQDQSAAEKPARKRLSDSKVILPGLLTEKMLNGILERMGDDMADQYQFDDDQTVKATELMKQRIPDFIRQHADDIQDLYMSFFEAQMAGEPPSVEMVTEWAQRAMPILNEFRGMVTETAGQMGEFMNEDQRVKLEGEMAAFETGLTFVNNKLQGWSEGHYDAATEWTPPGKQRRERDRAEQKALEAEVDAARDQRLAELGAANEAAAAMDKPDVQPVGSEEKPRETAKTARKAPVTDEWAAYTEEFIRKYQLDDAQSQRARLFLKDYQGRRDQYLTTKGDEVTRVTKDLKAAKTPEEKKAAQASYEKINGPVERMFSQFKDKLDTLPTSKQRRSAEATGEKKAGQKP